MLSGKGNENGEKTTIGVISNKATLHAPQIFLYFFYRCFARLRRETSLLHVLWREVVLIFIHYFFFHCRPFFPWWPLAFLSFSPPLQYFHVLRTKNVSILFYLLLWLSVALYLVELRWPVTYFLFFCLSLSLYSKFVDMKINLRLILYTTRIQRQFPLFVFVFIDSLVVKTRMAMRFPAKITSSCIWVAMPVD